MPSGGKVEFGNACELDGDEKWGIKSMLTKTVTKTRAEAIRTIANRMDLLLGLATSSEA